MPPTVVPPHGPYCPEAPCEPPVLPAFSCGWPPPTSTYPVLGRRQPGPSRGSRATRGTAPPTASGKAPRGTPSQSFNGGMSRRTYRPGDLLHLSLALQPRARRSPRPPCGTSPRSCRQEKTPWRAPAPPGSRQSAAHPRTPPRRAPRTAPPRSAWTRAGVRRGGRWGKRDGGGTLRGKGRGARAGGTVCGGGG